MVVLNDKNQFGCFNDNRPKMTMTSGVWSNGPTILVFVNKKDAIEYLEKGKYKINELIRKSDVEFINQGLTKYFSNNEEMPDLIIVDGGIQQINEAQKVLK